MTTIKIYKYVRADGGATVSPNKPEIGIMYTEMSRLVADEGKLLTNGDCFVTCIDVDIPKGWKEVDGPKVNEPKSK